MGRVLTLPGSLSQAQRGHLAMLGFSALVAGAFSLGHLASPFIAPEAMTVARFLLSAVMVGTAAALTRGIPRYPWPRRGDTWCWAG